MLFHTILFKLSAHQELSDMMKSKSQSRWGNKFGIMLFPIEYYKRNTVSDPLDCVKRAKAMIDRKKRSLEAHFSYQIGYYVMSYLGSKVKYTKFESKATWLLPKKLI